MKAKQRHRVSLADPAEWDELVQRFPDRTVFHRRAWLQSVEQAHRAKVLLARADSDQGCVAVWPCLEQRKGPFRILGSPLPGWSTVYLGPLFAEGVAVHAVLKAFFAEPMFCRAAYCYCKVVDADREVDLSCLGFTRVSRYRTYLLSLTRSEEELWKNMESRGRNMVRKAKKAGLEVRKEKGLDFVGDFWEMSREVFGRSNMRPTYSQRLLDKVCENLSRQGELLVLSAFADGRRAATVALPHDDQTVYYWAGAAFGEFRYAAPSNLLMWESIREARRLGLKRYDLVSIYGGPGKFKRTFGPEEKTTATHWERSRSWLVAVLKRHYERHLRRLQHFS